MMQEWFKKAKLGVFIHYGIYAGGMFPNPGRSITGTFLMKII